MSDRSILVINCGSSSIKFALVDESAPEFRASGIVECLGTPQASLRIVDAGGRVDLALPNADHRQALARLLPLVQVAAEGRLQGIGHRVVHGGEHFSQACRIDPQVMQNIRDTVALAPLHNPGALAGIEIELQSVFDITAFDQRESLGAHVRRCGRRWRGAEEALRHDAAGLDEHEALQVSRPACRDMERDAPAARMTDEMDGRADVLQQQP